MDKGVTMNIKKSFTSLVFICCLILALTPSFAVAENKHEGMRGNGKAVAAHSKKNVTKKEKNAVLTGGKKTFSGKSKKPALRDKKKVVLKKSRYAVLSRKRRASRSKKMRKRRLRYQTVKSFFVSGRTHESVTLKWNKVKSAKGYYLYRSDSKKGKYKKIAGFKGSKKRTYSDKNLTEETYYFYKVRVMKSRKYSPVLSVRTYKKPFEEQVSELKISTVGSQTRLEWKPIEDATEYRIYRKYYMSDEFTKIKTVSGDVLTYDDYADSGKNAYYMIRAKNSDVDEFSKYTEIYTWKTVTRVFIACGHGTTLIGTWDTGCTYGGYTEAGLMLPITKSMVEALRRSGVYVYTDADEGNNRNMVACVSWANKKKISVYTSIHCDYDKAPKGTIPLYLSAKGKVLAGNMNESVLYNMGMSTRGLRRRTDLYELNAPSAPSCIFETGNIKKDLTYLKSSGRYGEALAEGMCKYLDVQYVK